MAFKLHLKSRFRNYLKKPKKKKKSISYVLILMKIYVRKFTTTPVKLKFSTVMREKKIKISEESSRNP